MASQPPVAFLRPANPIANIRICMEGWKDLQVKRRRFEQLEAVAELLVAGKGNFDIPRTARESPVQAVFNKLVSSS